MDTFQEGRKNILVDKCSEMEMDTFAVQDLINEKGLFENSLDLLMQAMNQQYHNPLKMPKALPAYGNPYQRL